MPAKQYMALLIMAALHFIAMYILMYAMVDRLANIYPNLNQVYMAGIMTSPMIVLELILMKTMYHNNQLNLILIAASILVFVMLFSFIRAQTAIRDVQFLKSMIPHHAGAILMCEEAPIQDPEIKALCETIINSQQREIDQMKGILERLE